MLLNKTKNEILVQNFINSIYRFLFQNRNPIANLCIAIETNFQVNQMNSKFKMKREKTENIYWIPVESIPLPSELIINLWKWINFSFECEYLLLVQTKFICFHCVKQMADIEMKKKMEQHREQIAVNLNTTFKMHKVYLQHFQIVT